MTPDRRYDPLTVHSADDKKGVKRRDALRAVGIIEEDQEAWLGIDDIVIGEEVAVFGSNFEVGLRSVYPQYTALEREGRNEGVDSKPFLARYVAERLKLDNASGWEQMKVLAEALRGLS